MTTLIRPGITAAVLSLLLATPVASQIGIKGGVNLATFGGADADDYESTPGLNLGASLSVLSLGPVQVLGEAYYRQKGAEYSVTGPGTLEEIVADGDRLEIGLDYVEIPILARVDFGRSTSRVIPYLVAGPAFGWQLTCGVSFSGSTGTSQPDCDDLTDNFGSTVRNHEMGFVLGGGLGFQVMGIGAVSLDARFTRGLSKVGEGEKALNIRNQASSLMLGYSFGMPSSGGPQGLGR